MAKTSTGIILVTILLACVFQASTVRIKNTTLPKGKEHGSNIITHFSINPQQDI